MMRKGGIGNIEFFGDFAYYQAFRVGLEQKAHNAQPWLSAHGGKHVGKSGDVLDGGRHYGFSYISTIIEIPKKSRCGAVITLPGSFVFSSKRKGARMSPFL
jgi:hypothetical protein